MEVLVAKIHVDGGELSLSTKDNSATEVPGENAVIAVAGERLVLAVGVESLLGDHFDKLVNLVNGLLVHVRRCVMRDLGLDSHHWGLRSSDWSLRSCNWSHMLAMNGRWFL